MLNRGVRLSSLCFVCKTPFVISNNTLLITLDIHELCQKKLQTIIGILRQIESGIQSAVSPLR